MSSVQFSNFKNEYFQKWQRNYHSRLLLTKTRVLPDFCYFSEVYFLTLEKMTGKIEKLHFKSTCN